MDVDEAVLVDVGVEELSVWTAIHHINIYKLLQLKGILTSLTYAAYITHLRCWSDILVHILDSKRSVAVWCFIHTFWTPSGWAHIQRVLQRQVRGERIHGSIAELRKTILLNRRLCLHMRTPCHLRLSLGCWWNFVSEVCRSETRRWWYASLLMA